MRVALLGVCAALAMLACAGQGEAQIELTTLTAGTNPGPIAVNPVTNTVYVASFQDATVKVVNGATNLTVATVSVTSPGAIAVNSVTNMIYVADTLNNTVTVINGVTNVAGTPIAVGTAPITVAVNPVTNMVYVGNQSSNNVTIIDGSTNTVSLTLPAGTNPQVIGVNPTTNKIYVVNNASNNVTVIDGSTAPQTVVATVGVGANALSIGVNPATNLIYVANSGSGTVTVINGAINSTASNLTVGTGGQPRVLTVNPVSNKIYVANHTNGTVTVIDGTQNSTGTNLTVTVGSAPVSIVANPTTNQIYVANHTSGSGGGTLSVINGAVNTTASTTTVPFAVGAFPVALVVNPVTNQVYAADQSSNDVTIFNGATNVTATVTVGSSSQTNGTSIAVNPATNKIYVPNSFSNTVSVINGVTNATTTITAGIGTDVDRVAINPVTNKIYVTNLADSTVSVIDGATDTVSAVVTVGTSSQVNRTAIAVNPVTNKIYVTNSFSNTVTVIDGVTNGTTTITTGIGTDVDAVAVNPVTNKIYVVNLADGTVSVIDGATNTVSAVVTVGSSSQANGTSIAVNPETNKIYVPNSFSNTVTVIDGVTNATTTITMGIGTDVDAISINAITNKIYVVNLADSTVSVIDGATGAVTAVVTVGSSSQANRTSIAVNPVTNKIYVPNSFSNTVTVIDGATNTTNTVTPGTDSNALAINLATNSIYVTNLADGTVTAIAEEQVQAIPLTVAITPFAGNISNTATPTFTFTATSSFAPTAPAVQDVYFQVDTWEGPWIAAIPGSGVFTGTASPALSQGTHIVYSYATDGEQATSTGMTQALIGKIAAEVFTVIKPGSSTALTADVNPAAVAQTVTFTANVTSTVAGTLTGTVTFFDGGTSLGPMTLASGVATFSTSALTLGTHTITAVYSGDGTYLGSTSAGLSEVIAANNPVPTATSLAPNSATAGDPTLTLTVNGSSFLSGSVVDWNGTALTTTFVSATQLTAVVPAGDLAAAGSAAVTVFNPTPGGGTSGSLTFTINNPAPTLTSLSPTTVVGGGPAFTLTLTGSGFVNGSVVQIAAASLTTTFVSATQLTATVPSSDLASSGNLVVSVVNPTPGGGTSAGVTLTVTIPVPVLTTISPNSATAGGAGFTMTLTGTSFISTSTAQWNGAALVTTFVSPTAITAVVPASDIQTGGTASVTVLNPAGVATIVRRSATPDQISQSATSNALTFTVNNPVPAITTLAPNTATEGGAAFTLTVDGSNFVATSSVQWNGVGLTTTFVSATQLTAVVPAADILTGGTTSVTVFNGAPAGGTSSVLIFTIDNPAPGLTAIAPTSAITGGAAFTLTVNGSGFVSGTAVEWNGVALTTTFVSATQITAAVPAADIANGGTASVTVFSPLPGGGNSSAISFTINNPVPAPTTLVPASATAGAAAFTLTVNGSNFVNGATVRWNATALVTTFVSATQLTAAVPVNDVATGGTAAVTIVNPVPGGGTSAALTFTINEPVPTLGTLSPTSVLAGAAGFTVTVTGTNFVSGTLVEWNGVALTTTFVSATQVTAVVPAANVATAASVAVTVFNPLPGGGASAATTFTVNNPVPVQTSVSPTSALAGGAAFTLTVNGSNFFSGTVVQWNGAALVTTFISATQVTAVVPAVDIAAAGSASLTVVNAGPGGGTSSAITFVINAPNPVPTAGSLSPTTAVAGGAAFTLTVAGTGFINGTLVEWNGVALATTFVSATQVIAVVPAADIANGGVATVTILNPPPGGGSSANVTFTINFAVPTAGSLSPATALVGGAAFTLTVTGSNFVTGTVVDWNGVALTTTLVSATQVTAAVPALDLATAGSATVTTFNPAPGGGTSAGVTFAINEPVPVLGSLSQTTGLVGGAAFTLTVTGSNFVNGTLVEWNGVVLTTTFVSATQVTAVIPALDLAVAGSASVTVFTPTPGGGASTAVTFAINDPVPTLGGLSVTSATAGSATFTLTATGSNFVTGTVLSWNGIPLATTVVSGTQLTAIVPTLDLTAAGTASITVSNPAPGGGISVALIFTINDPIPALSSLSQVSAIAVGPAFMLTVTGSNFVAATVVEWNGVALATTFVSSTQVTALVPASDIAAGGSATVTVLNPAPGGGTSIALTFAILDFNVASMGPQTVSAGQAATFPLTTAPVGGAFPNPVTFVATGLPVGSVATFAPASVTPGASTTMTVTTTARTVVAGMPFAGDPQEPGFPRSFPVWPAATSFAALLAMLGLKKAGKNAGRRLIPLTAMLLLMATVGYLSGCAAGFPRLAVVNGTPAGTYSITVTASSGADVHKTVVMMTVQ